MAKSSRFVIPHPKFFKMANLRCKAGSTQVEEAVLIAAAIQGGIIGKGKTAGFVIELLQRSLIQRMVPINAITCGGGLSSDMLASSSQWNEGTAFGAAPPGKVKSLSHAAFHTLRNRIRAQWDTMMIKIQNLAESMFCVERSKYVEPQLYDSLVEGGSKMWRNASSFKRSMPKGSQNHAELSRSQRMFLADTLLDASWQPFDEDKFTAELVPGFKNPTWLMSTRDRKDDVQFHVHMSMNGGNPVPEDDAQEITMEEDPSRLYPLDYFVWWGEFLSSFPTLHKAIFQPLCVDFVRARRSCKGLSATETSLLHPLIMNVSCRIWSFQSARQCCGCISRECGFPIIKVFSQRFIKKGEESTNNHGWTDGRECTCGEENCVGTFGGSTKSAAKRHRSSQFQFSQSQT